MAIDWRKKVIFVQYNTKKKWIIKYIGPFSLKKRRKKFTELFEKGKYQTLKTQANLCSSSSLLMC